MDELEKLIEEQRRLNDRIRLLKHGCVNFGELDNIRYCHKPETEDGRGWQLCARMVQTHREHETWEEAEKNGHEFRALKVEYETNRWQIFIREKTKEEALAKIRQIIGDLSEVIDAWTKKDDEL